MFSKKKAKEFADDWLPAWSGNHPLELAEYYAHDCYYSDPACPEGISGKDALIKYFVQLLAKNPNWIWEQIEAIPMEKGFLNKWKAIIPVGTTHIQCIGVCIVQFNNRQQIVRNEVYFDRTELVHEFSKSKKL
ncbi:MAG: nuclear transport factor 2 family protein [Bacteroidota bacterium]